MPRSRSVVACLLVAVSVAAPGTAAFARVSGSWQVTSLSPAPERDAEAIVSIAASGKNNVWAEGSVIPAAGGLDHVRLYHLRGGSWRPVSLPHRVNDLGVSYWMGTSSPSNLWLVGSGATAIAVHWDGRRWSAVDLPGCCQISVGAAAVFGSSDTWAFGGIIPQGQATYRPYVAHRGSRSWTQVRLPAAIARVPLGILGTSAVSRSDIWALLQSYADSPQAQLIHWNGHRWSRLRLPAALVKNFPESISATGPSSVWIGAQAPDGLYKDIEALWHWTGHSWMHYTIPASVAAATQGAWHAASVLPDGHGGLWTLGFETNGGNYRIWDFRNGRWAGPETVGNASITISGLARVPGTFTLFGFGAEPGTPAQDTLGIIAKYMP